MTAQPVGAVLIVFYGPAAHQAAYGRHVRSTSYTKDFLQLRRSDGFLRDLPSLFPSLGDRDEAPIRFAWPGGEASGAIVRRSADRPHLKWETRDRGAPLPWRMTVLPTVDTIQTIPGDPDAVSFEAAEQQFSDIRGRGAGQPYLVAVRLRDDPDRLHLRVYLDAPDAEFAWADLALMPDVIQRVARSTSRGSTSAWYLSASHGVAPEGPIGPAVNRLVGGEPPESVFSSFGTDELANAAEYFRDPGDGLFFDPERNHDAWLQAAGLPEELLSSVSTIVKLLEESAERADDDDAVAERLTPSLIEQEAFEQQIEVGDFGVEDRRSSVKTRGSAQHAFSRAVRANYGHACAITGITTPEFLVAAHIVPWSADPNIRLDPSNGICLSLLVDRAYELGYLDIADDLTVRLSERVHTDPALERLLQAYDGSAIRLPIQAPPRAEYLQRRRDLVEARQT